MCAAKTVTETSNKVMDLRIETGQVPVPTKEEIALADLRIKIQDLVNDDPKLTDDLYLLLWLKHYNFQSSRAVKGSTKWRKENDLIVDKDLDPELCTELPIFMESGTKNGLPVTSFKVYRLDRHSNERIMHYIFQVCVKIENRLLDYNRRRYTELCEREGRRVPITADTLSPGGYTVLDCKGFALSLRSSPSVMQLTIGVTRAYINYFPSGLVSGVYYINMNKCFEVLFKIMKPLLALSAPAMKFEAFPGKEEQWKPKLLEFIDEKSKTLAFLKDDLGTKMG